MKLANPKYTVEILSSGFIKQEAMKKAEQRKTKIDCSSDDKMIFGYNPKHAMDAKNPGIPCEDKED